MSLFLRTHHDPFGGTLRIEGGFKSDSGEVFLLLHRIPPQYIKDPTFLVKLTGERVECRGEAGKQTYFKAIAIENLNKKEKALLLESKQGTVLPFFNFSYPNVMKVLGKRFHVLHKEQIRPLVEERAWTLLPAN